MKKDFFLKNVVGYIWNSLKASRVVYPEDRKSCSAVNLQGIQGCLNRGAEAAVVTTIILPKMIEKN